MTLDLCRSCAKPIPAFEDRHAPNEEGQGGNVPYVWWTPEPNYACSEECYRVAYLGCEPSKKIEKKKAICPDCRAQRGRCSVHQISSEERKP